MLSFLLILGASVHPSHLGSSVPRAMAPKTSIIRLAQSIWMTFNGIVPRVQPLIKVMMQITMFIVI